MYIWYYSFDGDAGARFLFFSPHRNAKCKIYNLCIGTGHVIFLVRTYNRDIREAEKCGDRIRERERERDFERKK